MNWIVDGLSDGRGIITNLAAAAIWAIAAGILYGAVQLARKVRAWKREYDALFAGLLDRTTEIARVSAGTLINTHAIAYLELSVRQLEQLLHDAGWLALFSLIVSLQHTFFLPVFVGLFFAAAFMVYWFDRRLQALQNALRRGLSESIFKSATAATTPSLN